MALYNRTNITKGAKPLVFDLDINNPPESLILLINPSNLDIKFQSKVTEQRIRWSGSNNSGYVFQAHHDELDTISAEGISAMFISDKGITRQERTLTLAYENFEHLLAMYKNNGINYNKKPGNSISPCMIDSIGRVAMTYDGYIYRGSFLSFNSTETEEKPFNISFSFEFKVTQKIDIGNLLQNQFLTKNKLI
jgi:hypothetical protein